MRKCSQTRAWGAVWHDPERFTSRAALFLVLMACDTCFAQIAPPSASRVPTLHVNTNLVLLDVSVTDGNGHPVTNLMRDDFRITEDKQPQIIRSFEAPAQHVPSATGPQGESVIVHTSADLAHIGQAPVTVVVLDEQNMRFEEEVYAREQVVRWLRRQPTILRQPVLLTALTYKDFQVLKDTTQDRDSLLNVLQHRTAITPWRSYNLGTVGGAASDAMASTLGALEQIAQAMRGLPGRKNVLWVGNGFPPVLPTDVGAESSKTAYALLRHLDEQLFRSRITLSILGPTVRPPNYPTSLETRSQTLGSETGTAAQGAVGASFLRGVPEGSISFSNLAPPTGGIAYTGRNDLDAALEEAETAGSSYYTLSYTSTNAGEDPRKYRRIHVEVLRPGLHLQTRDGYYPNATQMDQPRLTRPTKQQLAFDLYGAANSRLPYTDLHLTVNRTDAAHWIIHVRASDMVWQPDAKGSLSSESVLLAACFRADGKLLSRTFHIVGSDTVSTEVQLLGRDIPLDFALNPPPHTARLRFVVRNTNSGRLGAVETSPGE